MYTAELIDINQDGYVDLIIAGHEYEGAVTTIYWGNSYGKYFLQKSTSIPTVKEFQIVTDIDSEDIDNDGDRDIVLARVSSPGQYEFYSRYYIQILEKKGNNVFSDKTTTPYQIMKPIIGDIGFIYKIWTTTVISTSITKKMTVSG